MRGWKPKVAPKALFNKVELSEAVALILGPEAGGAFAARWFEENSARIDASGYFTWEPWVDELGTPYISGQPGIRTGPVRSPEQRRTDQVDFWHRHSLKERQGMLAGFSDLHLGLVMLVSDSAADRIGEALDLPPERLARRRANMRDFVVGASDPIV